MALLLYWDAVQLHVCMIQHKDKLIKHVCRSYKWMFAKPWHEVTMLTL